MDFDLRQLDAQARYKLLVSLIIPRPIALVTTVSPSGRNNAAPFSFFNVLADDPPLVVLGIGGREVGTADHKDTVQNIRSSGDFVVNLVDELLLKRMNICAIDFPSDIDELHEAGLTPASSVQVKAARIAESPVQLECREFFSVNVGRRSRTIVLGEVVQLHVRDEFIDPATLHVDVKELRIVGRLHGGGWYLRTSEWLHMPRMSLDAWQSRRSTG